jgi:hypothetical protein
VENAHDKAPLCRAPENMRMTKIEMHGNHRFFGSDCPIFYFLHNKLGEKSGSHNMCALIKANCEIKKELPPKL